MLPVREGSMKWTYVAGLVCAGVVATAAPGHADSCISLTSAATRTENFDTLATSGTANVLSLPGWSLAESGTSARNDGKYAAESGTGTTGDTISYGASGNPERALGSLRSGTIFSM